MGFAAEAVKAVATEAMKARFGNELGSAYAFVMVGGPGVPGLVDGAILAGKADSAAANELTGELAVGLVAEAAKATLVAVLKARAASMLTAAGYSAEVVATMTGLIVMGIFESTPVAPGTLPPRPPTQPHSPGGPSGAAGDHDGSHGHLPNAPPHPGPIPHNPPPTPIPVPSPMQPAPPAGGHSGGGGGTQPRRPNVPVRRT